MKKITFVKSFLFLFLLTSIVFSAYGYYEAESEVVLETNDESSAENNNSFEYGLIDEGLVFEVVEPSGPQETIVDIEPVQPQACNQDSDCDSPELCIGDSCAIMNSEEIDHICPGYYCSDDGDCSEGYCNNSRCNPIPQGFDLSSKEQCAQQTDCETGMYCFNGVCEIPDTTIIEGKEMLDVLCPKFYCFDNSECNPGFECDDLKCIPKESEEAVVESTSQPSEEIGVTVITIGESEDDTGEIETIEIGNAEEISLDQSSAQEKINELKEMIENIQDQDLNVSEAQKKLEQAQEAFNSGNFSLAEELAVQAEDLLPIEEIKEEQKEEKSLFDSEMLLIGGIVLFALTAIYLLLDRLNRKPIEKKR